MITNVSKRIKELRIEANLSQTDFGKLFNVSQDTVSLWEKGKSLPGIDIVIAMAIKFQVSSDYILGLTDI